MQARACVHYDRAVDEGVGGVTRLDGVLQGRAPTRALVLQGPPLSGCMLPVGRDEGEPGALRPRGAGRQAGRMGESLRDMMVRRTKGRQLGEAFLLHRCMGHAGPG